MAKKASKLVLMVPEGEKKSYKYSFTLEKSKAMTRDGRKFRMKKYDPSKRKHVWFEETRMPSHSK